MLQISELSAEDRDALSAALVLCVDVDGTLLRTDLLFESLLGVARRKPWLLTLVPWWLLRGKAYLKHRLAYSGWSPTPFMPFDNDLLAFLSRESAAGRRIVLSSGSDRRLVDQIAARLDFAVEVIASDGTVNLTGERKASALVERFGVQGFDYAGNARDDLAVWQKARHAILVNARGAVEEAARDYGNVTLVFPRRRNPVRAVLRAIRIHQWAKNALVLVPLIASHRFLNEHLVANTILAFIAMGLTASSIYVINDLADIEADRAHHSKRARPFAGGELSIATGFLLGAALLASGVGLSYLLPGTAAVLIASYTGIAIAYTFFLKRKVMADVVTLSLLYTIRVLVGGAAVSILVSPWLLAFSLFFFLSLAFTKRVTEMLRKGSIDSASVAGRGYYVPDTSALISLGTGSGYLACLVLSLYINSDSVRTLYPHPGWLWLLLPLLLNWMGRNWIVTIRGRMSDDPLLFLGRDFRTWFALLCATLILLLAEYCPFSIPGIQE